MLVFCSVVSIFAHWNIIVLFLSYLLCDYFKRSYSLPTFRPVTIWSILFECSIVGLRTIELIRFTKKQTCLHKDETNLSSDDLLEKDKSVSFHQRNQQILAPEIYKVRNYLGSEIIKYIFHFAHKPIQSEIWFNSLKAKKPYSVLRKSIFFRRNIFSCPPKYVEIVPCEIKNAKSLDIFNEKIELCKTDKCPYSLCKKYIGNHVGFD